MDTKIQLGSFLFKGMEVPEFINFGGQQMLAQHDLIGGNRVIDSLGKNDIDITWSGLITGGDSMERSLQLNKMRVEGQSLALSWFNLTYMVIIQNIVFRTKRWYQIEYDITLKVLVDGTNPNTPVTAVGFNEAIKGDSQTTLDLSNQVVKSIESIAPTQAAGEAALPQVDMTKYSDSMVDTSDSLIDLNKAILEVKTFNGLDKAMAELINKKITQAKSHVDASLTFLKALIF